MKIRMMVQGTAEWHAARKGIPTASEFDRVLTPKTLKPSTSQETWIYELIADALRTSPPLGAELYTSHAMAAGIEAEPKARAWYTLETGNRVQQIGFYTVAGRFGGSPDGLIVGTPEDAKYIGHCGATGEDLDRTRLSVRGGLELKCPYHKTQVKYLLQGGLPDEYRCQVHGHLALTGFDWWDFLSFCDDLPAHYVRVYPDAFTLALKGELDRFFDKYLSALLKLAGPGAEERIGLAGKPHLLLPPAPEQPML